MQVDHSQVEFPSSFSALKEEIQRDEFARAGGCGETHACQFKFLSIITVLRARGDTRSLILHESWHGVYMMEFQSPTPLQARAPMPIYLVHRTQWYKYFHYRKWRCDETTDLMGAHTTLEGAYAAVLIDFKKKAELSRTRWLPELWKEQKDKKIEEWPPGKQFTYINQFMSERKREDKEVDVGWTYLVTSTTLWQHDKKRKNSDATAERDEKVGMKSKVKTYEKLQLVVVKEDSDDMFEFSKENSCPSCVSSRSEDPEKSSVVEETRSVTERRSLGYYCQQ